MILEQGEARRQALFRAGLVVFKRQSVGETKVTDIVREAGVALGTFYMHFGSKQAFVAALHQEISTQIDQVVTLEMLHGEQSPEGQFHALWDGFAQCIAEFPDALEFLVASNAPLPLGLAETLESLGAAGSVTFPAETRPLILWAFFTVLIRARQTDRTALENACWRAITP